MTGSGLRLVAVMVSMVLLVSACAGSDGPSRDRTATARLDQATGQILTPLSEYDLTDSDSDIEVINRAVRIWMAGCMSKSGFTYSASMARTGISDDRDFGIWFEPNARVYGWGFPPKTIDDVTNKDAMAGGQDWQKAEVACSNKERTDSVLGKILPSQREETDSLLPNTMTEAYRSARNLSSQVRQLVSRCVGRNQVAGALSTLGGGASSGFERLTAEVLACALYGPIAL